MYFEIQGTYFKINALYFQTSALCFFFCVEAAKKSTNPGSVFVEKVFVFTCCPYCFFAYFMNVRLFRATAIKILLW